MSDPNLEPPSIQEELNRKAVDELLRLSTMHEEGVITAAEYKIGIDVMFNTVSGLVDRDFFEMITAAGADVDVKDKSFLRNLRMIKGDKHVALSWEKGGHVVIVESATVKVGDAKTIELENSATPQDVLAKVNQIKKKFTDAKYVVQ